ncbi:autotransporter outer membrane beta-barrel domain-containing protein [Campylobacter sp. RM16187]|uniref:autotransporter outer membrane beta-barrel domain-containing protein n=1 Tax=Campylobacter sp. RM16187 TaxID=1660063 RepID=UPI0021B5C4FE|nr:autotransporter outer membrane beta-barrel domain-containing protein [Campylobacter sp. RM16187]
MDGYNNTNPINIIGSGSNSGLASNNTINIKNKTNISKGYVVGGVSYDKDSTKNTVTVENSVIDSAEGGASIKGKSEYNKLTIKNSTVGRESAGKDEDTGYTSGGSSEAFSAHNTLIVENSNMYGEVNGGDGDERANFNTVIVRKSKVYNKNIEGGDSWKGKEAKGNKAEVLDSSVRNIYGGKSDNGLVEENTVNVVNSKGNNIFGGYSDKNSASKNVVSVKDSKFNSIYGGASGSGKNINNIVNLYGDIEVANSIQGGLTHIDQHNKIKAEYTTLGNTLNIHSKNVKTGFLSNFEKYNFYLPSDTKNGDTIVTITGKYDTNLIDTKIGVTIEGDSPVLKANDKVNLIKSEGEGKIITDEKIKVEAIKGVTTIYDFSVKKEGDKTLVATLNSLPAPKPEPKPEPQPQPEQPKPEPKPEPKPQGKINQQAYSLLSGSVASMTLNNRLNDGINGAMIDIKRRLDSKLVAHAANIQTDSIKPTYYDADLGLISFANISGFSSNYDNGNVDADGFNAIAGLAKSYDNSLLGAFLEYGYAKFDGDINAAKSDGNTKAIGVGALVKYNLDNNIYIDGHLRIGKNKTDYDSVFKTLGKVNYKTSAMYYGVGVGIGYLANIGAIDFDSKLGYSFTHVKDDEVEINKEKIKFNSINSNRVKFDTVISYNKFEKFAPYINAKLEYEFDGDSKLQTVQQPNGINLSQKGFSGGAGLGVKFTPSKASVINIEANQIVGKRDETSAKLGFAIRF